MDVVNLQILYLQLSLQMKEFTGLQFESIIKGGNVPREFVPSVEKGFKEAMKNGPLAGYEMDSMKVTLKDGSFHAVDSDAIIF